MSKFFRKLHEDIRRAPLSYAFLCFGAGMNTVGILKRGFGLSEGWVDYIAYLVIFAGIVYFDTNRKEEKPAPTPQGDEKGGTA